MDKQQKPEDDKPTSKKGFNSAASYYGIASGISGGMIVCTVCLGFWANTDSKLWLAGAAAGVLATVGSFIQMYQMARQDQKTDRETRGEHPADDRPEDRHDDKPDLKP